MEVKLSNYYDADEIFSQQLGEMVCRLFLMNGYCDSAAREFQIVIVSPGSSPGGSVPVIDKYERKKYITSAEASRITV